MATTPSFSEQMTARLGAAPADLQVLWKDLIRSIETGNAKRVEINVDKLTTSDSFASPGGREATVALSQLLALAVRETYLRPSSAAFEMYTALLPVFRDFLSKQARAVELKDHVKLLLGLGDRFLVTWYEPAEKRVVAFDNFAEFQMQNVRDFISSPGFKAWRNHEGSDEFLKGFISRKLIHLGEFARNRRDKPFLQLLDLLMLLLRMVPEFLPCFMTLQLILPCARKAFWYLYAGEDDGILKVLARAKQAGNPDLKPVIGEWMDIYTIGALPDVPAVNDQTKESPELTVPFVYRSLLEEVMGDGTISPDEEKIVNSMREHVEIPVEKYNRIFQQVQEAKKFAKIELLDRDFSPRVFLRKILDKTVEDGVVTDEERAIIGKVAQALTLSKETLSEVFAEAKQSFFDGDSKPAQEASFELECLYDLVRHIAMEERIRPVLISDRGIKVYQKAGKMLAALKQKAGTGPIGPVAAFYFEPQTYLYPVIAVFIETVDVAETRLRFKGRRVDVEFLQEVKSRAGGEDVWVEDKPLLKLFNDSLDLEIPVRAVLVGDNLGHFLDALEETKGKFAIMVMHYARMAPLLALRKDGRLDASGHLAEARSLIAAGKPREAITLLEMIRKGFPETAEIFFRLGEASEQAAAAAGNDPALRSQAFEMYKKELECDPGSDKTMRALGRMAALFGNWDDACLLYDRAFAACPVNLRTALAFVENMLGREEGVADEALARLGEAFRIWPTHPRVVALIEEVRKRTGCDPVPAFQGAPVDPKFQ